MARSLLTVMHNARIVLPRRVATLVIAIPQLDRRGVEQGLQQGDEQGALDGDV